MTERVEPNVASEPASGRVVPHSHIEAAGLPAESAPSGPAIGPLDDWRRRAQISIYAHNLADDHFSRRNGLVNAISLGGLVLLGQVATVADLSSRAGKVAAGAITVLLAVLGALALLWDFRAKALQHRFAARQYGTIRRALDSTSRVDARSAEAQWRREELRRLWDVASSTAPNPPERLRAQARAMYEERYGSTRSGQD